MSDVKSTDLVAVQHEPKTLMTWTDKQKELMRNTVAKGATNDEFDLFIYRCQHMELDPLVPGQVHFVKYGNNPGSVVVGIEGFRVRAARTGRHNGTKRGVLYDQKGQCIGAWCEVYRTDWVHPAREEVALSEYTTGKAMWSKMPQTMIKKVAEAAALRMAFPDALGGVYADEEMDRAAEEHRMRTVSESAAAPTGAPAQVEPPRTPEQTEVIAPKPITKPNQKPPSDPNPAQKPPTYFELILKHAEEKRISRDELSKYVQRVYQVESARDLNRDQVVDLYNLMKDPATDAAVVRYVGDPENFDTPFEPDPVEPQESSSPEVLASESTFQ